MITVKFQGRLGNRMFQYAFAYVAARKLKTQFWMSNDTAKIESYYKLRWKERYRRKFAEILLKKLYGGVFKRIIVQNTFDAPAKMDLVDNTHYEGYFQSLRYFDIYKNDIKRLFTIKKQYRSKFEETYKHLFDLNDIVAIHIRRTDYIEYGHESLGGKDLRLPLQYYKNSLLEIKDHDDHEFVFVSDNIEFVKSVFPQKSNYHYSCENEITDLQILSNADKLIISNSSFSWWGAFLNHKKNKTVYAPKYWSGFKVEKEYPNGILCKDWIEISVN